MASPPADRAFEHYSLLEQLEPGAFLEFWRGLTTAEKCRYAPWAVGRMLASSPPRIYPLQPIKAAFVEMLGVEDAACVYSPMYRPGKAWRLLTLGLDSLMDYARTHALAYEELIAPRDVVMSAPAVYGGLQLPGIAGRTRSVFLCALPDIVVSSKSNLLLANDRVLMDYQGDEITRADINLDAEPIVLSAKGRMLHVLDQAESARQPAIAEAFSLVGVHTWNFGHWIFEFMFQVWLCMREPVFDSLPLIVDEQMPAQLREMLALFVGTDHPIIVLPRRQSVRVAKLWCCSRIAYWPGGDKPGSMQALEEQIADAKHLSALLRSLDHKLEEIQPDPSHSRRLYLQRKDSHRRRMINRAEVEAWFASQGFDLVDLGDLTFEEQLRRIRAADCIVGPDGATFYALLFARPGTRIGMLAQPALEANEWWNQMFKELGLFFLLYVGTLHKANADYPSQSDVTIDMAGLPAFLAQLQVFGNGPAGSARDQVPPRRVPPIDCAKSYFPGPGGVVDAAELTSIQEHFMDGRYAEVLGAIEADPGSNNPAREAIEFVARAAMARASGDTVAVAGCIDAAFDQGVPLALLLRECGRHYLHERADYARAYECFSTLEQLEAGAMREFADKLPEPWRLRFAPAVAAHTSAAQASNPRWKEFWSTYRFDGTLSEELLFEHVGRTSNGKPLPNDEFKLCVEFMSQSLELAPSDFLFEYCCGNGLFTYELAAEVDRVVAVDFSDHLIQAAKQFRNRHNVQYHVGDAMEPLSRWLAGGKPSRFLMANALAYFDPAAFEQLLQGLCATVAPGAFRFLLTGIPDADRMWNFYDTAERKERYLRNAAAGDTFNEGMGRWWTQQELRTIAGRHGLSVRVLPEPGVMSHYRMAALLG